MLEVTARESYTISEIVKKSDGLYLRSEYGLLRLSPQSDSIIRVTFTRNEAFEENYGIGILPQECHRTWEYKEQEEIYEDCGDGYSYEKGEYLYTELSCNKGNSKVQTCVIDGTMKPIRDYADCEIVLHTC